MFIVTFHLLPESFLLGGLYNTLMGILLGVMLIVLVENNLDKKISSSFTRSSLLLGISIAVHNFPEGLALGSSFFNYDRFRTYFIPSYVIT